MSIGIFSAMKRFRKLAIIGMTLFKLIENSII